MWAKPCLQGSPGLGVRNSTACAEKLECRGVQVGAHLPAETACTQALWWERVGECRLPGEGLQTGPWGLNSREALKGFDLEGGGLVRRALGLGLPWWLRR